VRASPLAYLLFVISQKMPEIVSNSQQSSPSRGSSGSSGGSSAMMRCNQDRSPTKSGPDRNSFTNQAGSAIEVRLKRQLDDCERRRKDLVVLNQKSKTKKHPLIYNLKIGLKESFSDSFSNLY
jgi:hypothetical protein